jgi:hypothetical protein
MTEKFTRRDFLKLVGLGMGSLAFRPFFGSGEPMDTGELARVAIKSVSVYSEPWDKSKILYQRYRDELINIYYEVTSEHGPGYNPIWYRVWGGYIHSGYLERVKIRLNPVLSIIPKNFQLAEVTVPLSQSMTYKSAEGWKNLYRLYYESTHWVVGVEQGPDGRPWYRIKDELFDADPLDYFAPAEHFRPITAEELTPISPEVPPEKKRIEVSITQQTLTAYENGNVVLKTKISSGVPMATPPPGQPPTDTPKGEFHIQNKMPSKHMGDGNMTSDLEAYELPGVPWVCFFEPQNGVATHGTYWHTNYGMTMSHGCVNMRTEEAKWIFRWATPVADLTKMDTRGYGTIIEVT